MSQCIDCTGFEMVSDNILFSSTQTQIVSVSHGNPLLYFGFLSYHPYFPVLVTCVSMIKLLFNNHVLSFRPIL